MDDEQATIVIVKDDGKVVWRTHCVAVEVGYLCTGVILLWLAVPRRCTVGKRTMAEGGVKCRRHGFKGILQQKRFKSRLKTEDNVYLICLHR